MKINQVRFILGFLILLMLFQNCGPGASTTFPDASKDSQTNSSSSQSSNSPNGRSIAGSGLNSGSARRIVKAPSGGASYGGIAGGGSSARSISAGGSASAGGSMGGGSAGSGFVGIGGGGSDNSFRITKQPISKTIAENTEFFVGISVQGGQSPYTFKWYRNGEELPPKYGGSHYESYSDLLDRVYKEGEYHVVVADSSGSRLTSSKAQIRMIAKLCTRGNYFIDLNKRTNPNDGYTYFNDLFYYKSAKYLVSQHNPTISMMQLNNFINNIGVVGFGYFTLGSDVSNNQNFSIACSTDVPTIHTSVCAANNLNKCYFGGDGGYSAAQTYEGSVNFLCRNGYIEFISNTCRLVPVPPPENSGG